MSSTKYADEGTIAHALATMCLNEGSDAAAYVGRILESEDYEHAKLSPSGAKKWMTCAMSFARETAEEFVERSFSMEVTDEMAEYTQLFVDMVRARVELRKLSGASSVEMLLAQKLPIGHITGEEGATGEGDVLLISMYENGGIIIDVIDAKFGRGIPVPAKDNPQIAMYGLGALELLALSYDVDAAEVILTIHQPRIDEKPDDWPVTVPQLREFETEAKAAARRACDAKTTFDIYGENGGMALYTPGEHCRTSFCKVRGNCKALDAFVEQTTTDKGDATGDFEDLTESPVLMPSARSDAERLGAKLAACDTIEDWIKQVRAEVERRLLAGSSVPGYKLVGGKKGARQWTDKEAATDMLRKQFRLPVEVAFDLTLISPTSAEKLAKAGTIGKRQWAKAQDLITQKEGSPHVAPASDNRPEWVPPSAVDDFEDESASDLAG